MIDIVLIAPEVEFEDLLGVLSRGYEIVWIVYDEAPPFGYHKATITMSKKPEPYIPF